MTINPAIRQMVPEAKSKHVGAPVPIFAPFITAELARLGFEKATKQELRDVIRRAMNGEDTA